MTCVLISRQLYFTYISSWFDEAVTGGDHFNMTSGLYKWHYDNIILFIIIRFFRKNKTNIRYKSM
jgi:hypothetical protein